MVNVRELKHYLTPLLERRPDLAYRDRTLFFHPVKHYLRGVGFFTSPFSDWIKFVPICDILFDGGWTPNLGGRLGPDTSSLRSRYYHGEWREDPERAWREVFRTLEMEVLPLSQHIDDPVALDRSPFSSSTDMGWQDDRLLGLCALGDFDTAEKMLDTIVADGLDWAMESFGMNIPDMPDDELKFSERHDFVRIYYLHRVMKRNRAGVFPLLHDWEAHKVKTLKLTKFWKPTPFPGER